MSSITRRDLAGFTLVLVIGRPARPEGLTVERMESGTAWRLCLGPVVLQAITFDLEIYQAAILSALEAQEETIEALRAVNRSLRAPGDRFHEN